MSEEKPKKKRFRKKDGMLFQVPIGYAFFNYRDQGKADVDTILKAPLLFRLSVDAYVLKDGLWPVLGVYKVRDEIKEKKEGFMIDHKDRVMRWKADGEKIPITLEEAREEKLEELSSWGHGSVEQRLRDHFAERLNHDVEEMYSSDSENFPDIKTFYAMQGYDFTLLDENYDEEDFARIAKILQENQK
jgi:hypothetical protein